MTTADGYDLIVIGGGPKGAALAAKIHVLNELGLASLRLLVIERDEIGSHWTGRTGLTPGTERLGTRPEKDVGFPYQSTQRFGALGPAIDARMAEFAWHSYLMKTGRYRRWIDGGLLPPSHREFADYLKWVFVNADRGVEVLRATVTRLVYQPSGWRVLASTSEGAEQTRVGGGVVITGVGRPNALACDPAVAGRVVSAQMRRDEITRSPFGPGARVCLVGAGESAATFALFLLKRYGDAISLSIVSPSLPYSRAESAMENSIYSDPHTAAWAHLPEAIRGEFIRRTDRGVISPSAMAELNRHHNVAHVLGRVRYVGAGVAGRAEVVIDQPDEVIRDEYDVVVNCTGASPLCLLRELLDEPSEQAVEAQIGLSLHHADAIIREIDESLALRGLHPKLFIPGIAGLAQGPGFANLSSLGLLSDRILADRLDRLAVATRRSTLPAAADPLRAH